jgi:hypothetical protein
MAMKELFQHPCILVSVSTPLVLPDFPDLCPRTGNLKSDLQRHLSGIKVKISVSELVPASLSH